MIFNAPIETMTAEEKETLQSQKLRKLVERCYKKVLFYQELFDASNINHTIIQSIRDIEKLPFTTAASLSVNYPFGLLTMPLSGVALFEQTPDLCRAVGFTAQDLAWQNEMIARLLVACDITTTSVLLQLPEPFPSSGSRSLRQTAEMLGVTVIASHSDNAKGHLKTIFDFCVTTVFGTPDKLLAFADFLRNQGISNNELPLKNLVLETQSCPSDLRNILMEKFELPVYTFYGRPDVMNLGIAGECYQQKGLHIHEDHFYPEIIDPNTGAILADCQPGELVLTTLSREATPLIRYRTGEKAVITHERCKCGRTSARITFVS